MTEIIDTDVLIIGGGLAGIATANEVAKTSEAECLLATKGVVGKSGASISATIWLFPPVFPPSDSPDQFMKDFLIASELLAPQAPWKAECDLIPEISKEMEQLGIHALTYPDDSYVLTFALLPIARSPFIGKYGHAARLILDRYRSEFFRYGIPYLNDHMATNLLTQGGRVVGATLFDYGKGETKVVRAKNTVIATGSTGVVWKSHTHSTECTWDGHAMGYRVGAELMDIEMQVFQNNLFAYPETWRRLFVLSIALPPKAPGGPWGVLNWYNQKGERFLQGLEIAAKHTKMAHLYKQMKEGKVGPDLVHYADLSKLDQSQLKEYCIYDEFMEKLGKDTRKDMLTCKPRAHTNEGGFAFDVDTQTTVPGLYAAGGAARTPMPCLYDCIALAKLFVKNLRKRMVDTPIPKLDTNQIMTEEARIMSFTKTTSNTGLTPDQVHAELKEMMWEKAGPYKYEPRMKEGLNELKRIKEKVLPQMRLSSNGRSYNLDWLHALELPNMIEMSELYINACIFRKETRAELQRFEDYPTSDNVNWVKNVIIKNVNGQMQIQARPPEFPYLNMEGAAKRGMEMGAMIKAFWSK